MTTVNAGNYVLEDDKGNPQMSPTITIDKEGKILMSSLMIDELIVEKPINIHELDYFMHACLIKKMRVVERSNR